MIIIGVDYHPSDQYIAFTDTETGECGERRLNHSDQEAEKFYRELALRGVSVRVGMEATGYSRWFERLLAELGIEVWIGDAAEIKTKRVRKQKTDPNDARLLLKLLLENTFPRIWVPSPENRSSATAVASASAGADADADHESAAGSGDERGTAKEEKAVERTRTSTAGKTSTSYLGIAAPAGSARIAGPHESDHRSVNRGRRAGSEEMARGAAADNPPGSRTTDGTRLRADHRNSGAVPLRQADRQLCRTDPIGGLQCWPSTAGTHHQARQLSTTFLVGRSSTSRSAM